MAKKQTPQVTRKIPYRFVCEHCGAQIDWKYAQVTGASDAIIDQQVIPKAMKAVRSGNYYDLNNIVGKCGHCGHRQSWELGEAKAWMRKSPLMGLGLGCMAGGVGAFAAVFFFGILGAGIIFVAVSLLGMIAAFIYGLVQYLTVKSEMKKTTYRHIPEVIWYQQQVEPATSEVLSATSEAQSAMSEAQSAIPASHLAPPAAGAIPASHLAPPASGAIPAHIAPPQPAMSVQLLTNTQPAMSAQPMTNTQPAMSAQPLATPQHAMPASHLAPPPSGAMPVPLAPPQSFLHAV